jgi:hypothetical protein
MGIYPSEITNNATTIKFNFIIIQGIKINDTWHYTIYY